MYVHTALSSLNLLTDSNFCQMGYLFIHYLNALLVLLVGAMMDGELHEEVSKDMETSFESYKTSLTCLTPGAYSEMAAKAAGLVEIIFDVRTIVDGHLKLMVIRYTATHLRSWIPYSNYYGRLNVKPRFHWRTESPLHFSLRERHRKRRSHLRFLQRISVCQLTTVRQMVPLNHGQTLSNLTKPHWPLLTPSAGPLTHSSKCHNKYNT